MKKAAALALVAYASIGTAYAQTMTWASAPVFVGQTVDAKGNHALTWHAAIQSTKPDASGYYELWVQVEPRYQESFADVIALEKFRLCNASGSNACVQGQTPAWTEYLLTPAS